MFSGFFTVLYQEFRRIGKREYLFSYLWFLLLVGISFYGLGMEKFDTQRENPTLMKGQGPLADIINFTVSYAGSTAAAISQGRSPPAFIFPAWIGIVLLIIVPILLGLTMLSRLSMQTGASTIAREREDKTLYLLATSQSRPSIYIGKFLGGLFIALPMVVLLALGTYLFSTYLAPLNSDSLAPKVFLVALSTTFLFISLGTLISALSSKVEKASKIGGRIIGLLASLTTLWILLPLIDYASTIINTNIGPLKSILEWATMISPLTQDMVALYNGNMSYTYIQIAAGIGMLLLGIGIFVREDVEY